ncbi:glycoside hydrolase family 3 protein [Flagellimonas olearia]|uniref:beta-N-acetylhexosaminidase n=1 Tax=Flagellimonas olearia TaxID=552546 RepID=A0A6I1EBP2_9FLAO|nr:glycoside hydrolase family 3 N-terminal domain-containing protein [Allomuricauda olearia]KAB7531194.1 glycoside hydrolase family 3 protein [Allomuricauda olearia]
MHKKILPYTSGQKDLSLRQKVGQLFMPAVFINDTEEEVTKMEQLIQDHHVGALCFFHSRASAATNFEGKKKVVHNEKSYDRLKTLIERYQKAAQQPLLIAIDAEWGLAMRIENTSQYPYAITLGALTNNLDLIEQVGQHIGLDCKEAGIHWNLSPVVDINSNPENPVIGYRSFGDSKDEVLSKAGAYLKGMASSGTLNSLKHFPGHGDTATDSHLGLPVIDKSLEELQENELYPFHQLIQNGVDSVMVGHLLLPQLDSEEPSTTSSKIITDLLRNTLGFDGVVISDALNMHAVSQRYPEKGKLEATAFAAGMDMLCFSEHVPEGITEILKTATEAQIEQSFERIWQLKEKTFSHSKDSFPSQKPSELNRLLAQNTLTELYGDIEKVSKIKSGAFLNLSVNNSSCNGFSVKIEEDLGQKQWDLAKDKATLETLLEKHQNVVLSIFPPAVKPKNNFGFENEVLDFIKYLIAQKNVLIYLFGNPYALDIMGLSPTSNAVVVYQGFPEFQEEAFQHFIGKLMAKGKLPVQLKTFQP